MRKKIDGNSAQKTRISIKIPVNYVGLKTGKSDEVDAKYTSDS